MKRFLFIILLVCFLCGCSNILSYDESLNILEAKNYKIEKLEGQDYFNVKNVDRIVVEDGLYLATIYYCKSKDDAEALFNIIYNIYLSYMYSGDIYGFNNSFKIRYGLISAPECYPDSVSGIDREVLESIDYVTLKNVYLFGGDIKRSFLFPSMYLPDTYEEFKKGQDYFTPQCFTKGNNVYFGSLKLLGLIS